MTLRRMNTLGRFFVYFYNGDQYYDFWFPFLYIKSLLNGVYSKVERWTQQTWNAKMSLTEWHPLQQYIFPLSLRLYHFLFIPGHQIFCTDNEKVNFSVVTSTDLFRVCRGYFRSPERSFILCCGQRMYVSSTVRDFEIFSFWLMISTKSCCW